MKCTNDDFKNCYLLSTLSHSLAHSLKHIECGHLVYAKTVHSKVIYITGVYHSLSASCHPLWDANVILGTLQRVHNHSTISLLLVLEYTLLLGICTGASKNQRRMCTNCAKCVGGCVCAAAGKLYEIAFEIHFSYISGSHLPLYAQMHWAILDGEAGVGWLLVQMDGCGCICACVWNR